MKVGIRDLMFVIVVAAVHFGLRNWIWAIFIPPTVALVVAIGLSRSTRTIMFSSGVSAFACLASALQLTVELFQRPIEHGGLPWSQFWDFAIVNNVVFAMVGAGIGAFVGYLVRLNSPATKS